MALEFVQETFPDMEVLSLSGNFCTDKKSAAVNWWVLSFVRMHRCMCGPGSVVGIVTGYGLDGPGI